MDKVAAELNTFNRALKVHGRPFTFTLKGVNRFKEAIESDDQEVELIGIFHEEKFYVTVVGTEASKVQSKPRPMILCLLEDANKLLVDGKLVIDQTFITMGGIKHKAMNIKDVNLLGIIADISLEVVT